MFGLRTIAIVVFLAWFCYRAVQRLRQLPSAAERVGHLAGFAVSLVPAVVLLSQHPLGMRRSVALGALSWATAVLVKFAGFRLGTERLAAAGWSSPALGLTQGLLSSVCELGSAALFFWFGRLHYTLAVALGFGAGAAMIEAIVVLLIDPMRGTSSGPHLEEERVLLRRDHPHLLWISILVERAEATAMHVLSRILMILTVSGGSYAPAGVAVAGFAAVDGLAYYALRERWKWSEAKVLWRFYGFCAIVVLLLAVVLAAQVV